MSNETLQTRDGFKSQWGFILACIGSAVGMGNIWRFPIMVAKYGGMTFLLPYFLIVVLVGSSGVIEEFALGRRAQAGPIDAFGSCTEARTGNKKLGQAIGLIPIVGALMLAIGYTVVMSWIFKYAFMSITGGLYAMGTDMGTIGGTFGGAAPEAATLGEALSMMFSNGIFGIGNGVWLLIGLVVALIIMAMGVANGIEVANKIMMPVLFGLFVILAVYIAFQPGASDGYKFLFTLDPKGLLSFEVWVFAFGQAFFSLSVAGNGSVIYGSYLPKNENIPNSALRVAFFDTVAALLAAFVIIPAIGASGFAMSDVTPGPGLMFVYLVNILNGMPGGRVIGVIFYVAVLFAGLSSIVNLYEAPVATMQEQFKLKRGPAVAIIGVVGAVVALLIQPWTSQWMDVVSIYICPLGAALAAIMFFVVLPREKALEEVNRGAKKPIGSWFIPLGYGFIVLCIAALILGVKFGGIG
ncbi:sodium-dependent transporter [uncultured Oscillibacter sp.]|jgi:NSS family neurotransmitter:Na+ symporter|uniref:sodium-dependent transporter n=1 Tax=uncultured Oscillibacter sp. TaxID=876091 RepID=UPI0025FB0BF3|nr:sodium-dependent transporter [uncultured Oscillibacter sp.]